MAPASFEAEESRIRAVYSRRPRHDARYSWFNPGSVFIAQERERCVQAFLERRGFAPLDGRTVLEVGCGTGFWLREFVKWGAAPENVVGVELIPERVAQARALCPPAVKVICGSAAELTLPDHSFDLVVQSTVFSSILDGRMKSRVASEMLRVLKPGGAIIWYDYRVDNPWNPDAKGIGRMEISRLFPGCRLELRRITPVPQVTRFLARYSILACVVLSSLPWACTHYLGVIHRRGA